VNGTKQRGGARKRPAAIHYPIKRIALERTIRLVATAALRDPVLPKLVSHEMIDDLAEIEGATSGRLLAERHGTAKIKAQEFVAIPAHAKFINAAFAYWRPRELNRFNGPGRGAWYAALDVQTSLEEVAYHMVRELERANDFNAVVEYVEMFASFAGEFLDLRTAKPTPLCLNPDPSVGYPEGNRLAELVRAAGHNGIVYPSVRHRGGTCIVALSPHAVQSVAQGRIWRLKWAGQRRPTRTAL
jgi:RES domain-containing protein